MFLVFKYSKYDSKEKSLYFYLTISVEDVKKAWSKLQEQEAAKKIKESNMRRSLRSSNLDTSKDLQKTTEFCRRSLRSSSIDKSSVTG